MGFRHLLDSRPVTLTPKTKQLSNEELLEKIRTTNLSKPITRTHMKRVGDLSMVVHQSEEKRLCV